MLIYLKTNCIQKKCYASHAYNLTEWIAFKIIQISLQKNNNRKIKHKFKKKV